MVQASILALILKGADELGPMLRNTLVRGDSFGFEFRESHIPEEEAETGLDRLVVRAMAGGEAQLLVLCLSGNEGASAKPILDLVRKAAGNVPVVLATRASDPEACREVVALGPDDFITAPFRPVDVLPRIWRLLPNPGRRDPLVLQLKEKLGLKQLVGESPALLAEIAKIPPVALCDASVLITGETGTGKEMFARAVHFLSPRSAKPFNPLNCGAIPVDLVENEMFGHDPGAFTGASSPSMGLLRQTDGGTLFLDEVDCLPLLAQVKLLRFLQDKEFRPLGAQKPSRVDVRVIAASNADLEDAVRKGRFRRDLFYRLNVIGLGLPPLRERKEDIPLLARHFVEKHATAFKLPVRGLTPAAVQKLKAYDWPGNVRELENTIERSVVLTRQTTLGAEDIQLPIVLRGTSSESFQALKARTIAIFERGYIENLLLVHNGNITRAARAAGKHRRAFWEMMRKHRITFPSTTRG